MRIYCFYSYRNRYSAVFQNRGNLIFDKVNAGKAIVFAPKTEISAVQLSVAMIITILSVKLRKARAICRPIKRQRKKTAALLRIKPICKCGLIYFITFSKRNIPSKYSAFVPSFVSYSSGSFGSG